MVCSGGPILLRAWMQQVAALRRKHGVEIVWVTSGAIASAVDHGFKKSPRQLAEKQALSAIGQPIIMDMYNLALQSTGLRGAQILLTYDDLANRERRANFKNTLEQLLSWGVTPILNENDAVATQEIKFGDNDSLSAKVAHVSGAERLIILTDVEGLYDADPKKNQRARLVPRLPKVTSSLLSLVEPQAKSARGTGGMYSKLKAAHEASNQGIETWLVKGDLPNVLLDVAQDRTVGTLIESRKKASRAKR